MSDTSFAPMPNRDRLIYVSNHDFDLGKDLCNEFLLRGFQVSLVPDVAAIVRLTTIRRPDVVVVSLCDSSLDCAPVIAALDAIRGMHLGIASYLLVPEGVRAEMVALAIKHGASDASSPPFSPSAIVDGVEKLLDRQFGLGGATAQQQGFRALTYRERQVLQLVVEGKIAKEIATILKVSFRTVEVHRRHIMEKTGAKNAADLVRLSMEH